MYSPKIAEDLIPLLYSAAKQMRIPMTEVVDKILRDALMSSNIVLKENNPIEYKSKEV